MTHEQRLIKRVVLELADGDHAAAGALLGVSQPTMSHYMGGKRKPRRSVVLLAELLLVTCGASEGVVPDERAEFLERRGTKSRNRRRRLGLSGRSSI